MFYANKCMLTTTTNIPYLFSSMYNITYALHNEYIKLARLDLHVKGYISNYIKSPHLPRYISI